MPKKTEIIVNAVKLDAKTPIPLETNGRGYLIQKGRNYVPFLDSGDNFFQILTEACLLSPTNLGCVNSKTKFSIGRGLMQIGDTEDSSLSDWVKSVNKKGESLNDIIKDAFINRYTVGNAFIEVIRTKVGSSRYIKIFNRNYNDCRLVLDDDDIPVSVIVDKRLRKKGYLNIKDDERVEIPLYHGGKDQEWYKDEQKNEHVIIHLKNKMPGYEYYGMPSNVACLPQQILDYKVSRFNLDQFDNNLVIGGLIMLQGNLSPEEGRKVAREITNAHTGDGKRGKYVILSSEAGVENSKVVNFDQSKDYDYIEGDKRIEEKIIFSNEWSKSLIDPQAGGMGNSGKQVKEIYETKMNVVIGPEQQFMIEKFINPLMKICSEWMNVKWVDLELGFDNIPFLGLENSIDAGSVLTVDEGREALGYGELEGGDGKKLIKDISKREVESV